MSALLEGLWVQNIKVIPCFHIHCPFRKQQSLLEGKPYQPIELAFGMA